MNLLFPDPGEACSAAIASAASFLDLSANFAISPNLFSSKVSIESVVTLIFLICVLAPMRMALTVFMFVVISVASKPLTVNFWFILEEVVVTISSIIEISERSAFWPAVD